MKINSYLLKVLLITFPLFLLSCSEYTELYIDKFEGNVTLSREANLTYTYLDEIDTSQFDYDLFNEALNATYVYDNSSQIVDNSIYNFIFVLVIKSDIDLYQGLGLSMKRCSEEEPKNYMSTLYNNLKIVSDGEGKYIIKLYMTSNSIASSGYLNDISDLCLFHYASQFNPKVNVSELRIEAEEIRYILNSLGINHDKRIKP